MTNQEYTRFTGPAYCTKYSGQGALAKAIRLAKNKHNICKTKIVMLDGETGTFAVMQNSLANKFIKAGYEQYHVTFADMPLA